MNNGQSTIMKFINDIIAFIDGKFAADTRISATKKPTGHLAFNTSLIKNNTKHFYVVQCLNEMPRDETFNSVETVSISLQITVFALKGSFGGITYLAEPMSIILQDTISRYMSELKYGDENDNICLMRQVGSSPALPYEDGSRAYTSALRYEFAVMADYVSKS